VSPVRRILLWVLTTLTVLVLLFGYHTSTSSQQAASSVVAPGSGFSATTGTGTGSGGTASGTTASGRTVAGPVADTRWGPVQVRITVDGGSLTGVTMLQYPSGNGRDQEINDYALPILIKETVHAKSANIDMVSGATVTSEGYLQSLQGALDQAGL
jgi:uncharacterized protein with FMN-binding domain